MYIPYTYKNDSIYGSVMNIFGCVGCGSFLASLLINSRFIAVQKRVMLVLFLLGLTAIPTIFCVPAHPAIPAWPQKFTINFDVRVEQYGDDWHSIGTLYYDYNIKVILTIKMLSIILLLDFSGRLYRLVLTTF